MRDRRKEGQLIKRAIKKVLAHLQGLSVKVGKGTAGRYWHIDIDDYVAAGCSCTVESWGVRNVCQPCKDKWKRLSETATRATVESGAEIYYSDNSPDRVVQVNLILPSPALKMVTEANQ